MALKVSGSSYLNNCFSFLLQNRARLRNCRHLRARLPETTHRQSPSWLLDELEGP